MDLKKLTLFIMILFICAVAVFAVQYQFDNQDFLGFFNITNVSHGMFINLGVNGTYIDDWSDVNITTDLSNYYNTTQIDTQQLAQNLSIGQVNTSLNTHTSNTSIHFLQSNILINASQVENLTDLDTHVEGDGIYLYNTSTTMYLNETKLNTTIDSRLTPSVITYLNLTISEYGGDITNGSLTGYEAANAICNDQYVGTHLCTEDDIVSFIENGDISTISGLGRVTAGGAKYVPASIPVNDCEGLTYSGTTDAQGNFWNFDVGYGVAANCALTSKLACCR